MPTTDVSEADDLTRYRVLTPAELLRDVFTHGDVSAGELRPGVCAGRSVDGWLFIYGRLAADVARKAAATITGRRRISDTAQVDDPAWVVFTRHRLDCISTQCRCDDPREGWYVYAADEATPGAVPVTPVATG